LPLSLKTINHELAKRGHQALLSKGDGYFYFSTGEAADWLDRTVRVPTVSSHTLDQWVRKFEELKRKNIDLHHSTHARHVNKSTRGGGSANMNKQEFKKRLEELAEGKKPRQAESGKQAAAKTAKKEPQGTTGKETLELVPRDVKRVQDALSAVKASVAKLEEEIKAFLQTAE
jgi:hypothetical protein